MKGDIYKKKEQKCQTNLENNQTCTVILALVLL